MLASTRQYQSSDSRLALSPRSYPARTFAGVLPPHYHGRLDVLLCGNGPWCRPCFLDSNDQRNLATNRPTCIYWGRFRKRKKSYAKRALMPPRRGIGRTHGKRCLKVCNAASLSVFSDEQHGFFGVDFVMRNVQLEVLRIHQRL